MDAASQPSKIFVRKSETKWKQTAAKKRATVRYHTAGNIKVGIYQFVTREIVFWEENHARKFKNFTKASRTQDADEFATGKVKELAVMLQGGVTLLQGDEARSYAVAKTLRAELHNVPLDVILREVIAALRHSGASSIMECAKLYRYDFDVTYAFIWSGSQWELREQIGSFGSLLK
jgi:hypothetical protein